jgi:phage tail tape-measure protein
VWDRTALRDLSPAPDHVDVTLGEPVALARRFNPVASDAETQRWTDPQKIPVDLAGDPVVLRLVPRGASGGAGGGSKGLHTGQPRRGCAAGARDKHARKLKHKRTVRAKRRRARFAHGRRPRASWSLQCVSSATRLRK